MARRSRLNSTIAASHAFSFAGASDAGQYPSGHFGDTCFGLRLNSRMSHCAMRMCSSSIHAVRKVRDFCTGELHWPVAERGIEIRMCFSPAEQLEQLFAKSLI